MTTLEKAVSLDPENGTAHALLGKLYQDAGKQDKAITEFEAANRLRPNDREVIYRLYRIYSLKGDTVNGRSPAERAGGFARQQSGRSGQ